MPSEGDEITVTFGYGLPWCDITRVYYEPNEKDR
jgi:hypothetical protein